MRLLKPRSRSVVGLDIEPGFVAAAEFTGSGPLPLLTNAATRTLSPGLFHDGEVVEVDGLAEQLKGFFSDRKLSHRVRLGVASQRVVLRVMELPAIEDEKELETAVRFQAQEELPMPLDQAVLDHRVIERFTQDEKPRMRVLVVAVRRDTVEHLLAAARKADLSPELVDLSAFAMVRALYLPPYASTASPVNGADVSHGFEGNGGSGPVQLAATVYCYLGGMTNLAIAKGTTCVFNRVLPNGIESMAAALAERRGLTLDHARQWMRHVALEREVEHVEGEVDIVHEAREVLVQGFRRIVDEIRLSVEYYSSSVPDAPKVDHVVLAGPGIAIPGVPATLQAKLGLAVQSRSLGHIEVRPGVLDGVDGTQLTVAAGLALNEVAA
jgi:type IV pilus assembly protein PilM